MNRALKLHPTPIVADRVLAAKGVVTRSDGLAFLPDAERRAILDLAWAVLREDHLRRGLVTADPARDETARNDRNVITLAKVRLRRRQRITLDPNATPRRPRIVVRPANPTEPGDAA